MTLCHGLDDSEREEQETGKTFSPDEEDVFSPDFVESLLEVDESWATRNRNGGISFQSRIPREMDPAILVFLLHDGRQHLCCGSPLRQR